MRTRAILWSLKLVAAAWAFAAAPVHAGLDSLILGQGFEVGGIEFRIGYGQKGHQPPTYYFATRSTLGEHEGVCSQYCLHNPGLTYHHKSCPALLRLVDEHGFSIDYLVGTFGPDLGIGYSGSQGHRSSYRGISNSYGVPPEQISAVGSCRVWYPEQPVGHQPPPVDCLTARQTAPSDAYVIYDGPVFSGH